MVKYVMVWFGIHSFIPDPGILDRKTNVLPKIRSGIIQRHVHGVT